MNFLAVVAAATGLVAAIGAVSAAVAAGRSATAAQQSADDVRTGNRHALEIRVQTAAHQLIAESEQTVSLQQDCVIALSDLAIHRNAFGQERHKLLAQALEAKGALATARGAEARSFLAEPAILRNGDEHDLIRWVVKLEAGLAEVRRVAGELQRSHGGLSELLLQHQAQAIGPR